MTDPYPYDESDTTVAEFDAMWAARVVAAAINANQTLKDGLLVNGGYSADSTRRARGILVTALIDVNELHAALKAL